VPLNDVKRPWLAATLAFLLGGFGCFYLGWRRGAKASLAWLLAMAFILVNARLPEPTIFFLLLLQAAIAWKAYSSCKRTIAGKEKAAAGAPPGLPNSDGAAGKKSRCAFAGWKRSIWSIAKAVLVVIGAFGAIMGLFLIHFSLVDWHYARMQKSIHPGMTIEEVLGAVHENGCVTAYPVREGNEDSHGVTLYGPHEDARYGHFDSEASRNETLAQDRAATMLRENMIPGRDYHIGFTFTPGVGPHWSMAVILGPDGKVKEIVPVHTWD
jgi:hypothetical protein